MWKNSEISMAQIIFDRHYDQLSLWDVTFLNLP